MRRKVFLLIPVILITIAESFFFIKSFETTLLVHGINLLFCVLFPLFLKESTTLCQSFSLVSVLRMLNIGMPVFFTMTIYWLPFIYGAAILAAYFVVKREENLRLRERIIRAVNFFSSQKRKYPVYLCAGIIIGLVLANAEFSVLKAESLIPSLDLFNLIVLAVVMFLFVGFGEELIFRFILQTRLEKEIGRYHGLFLASFLFMTMHSGYSSIPYLIFVFIVGLILGYAFYRTRSLFLVTVIHGSINFFLFSLIPHGYLAFT
jgi:membrane protease YdiL (CAAX protease family)